MVMGNLMIYGEPHYRQNYLDQILLDERCSFGDPDIIPKELRVRVDSFYAKQGSFNLDDDIYDKCLDMTKKYQEKYGEITKTN